jgi:hypothetical protein
MTKFARLLASMLVSLPALLIPHASQAEVNTNWWGSWAQVVAEGNLSFIHPDLSPFRLWLEGQSRWNDDWQDWYQGVARVALGYAISDRATVWVGYSFVPTQIAGTDYFGQQDVWPAFRYVWPTELGTFTFRTMLEANFIHGNDPRLFPRQLIRFMRPLEFEPRLSLVLWDEVLARGNNSQWGGEAGFGQNRAFAGGGWSFSPLVRVELGYMHQYIDSNDHHSQVMQNMVVGSMFINF